MRLSHGGVFDVCLHWGSVFLPIPGILQEGRVEYFGKKIAKRAEIFELIAN